MTCCDVNGLDRIFRGSLVTQEKRAFLKRGLNPRQQSLFNGVTPTGKTVLDIGCGVGALGSHALRQGARGAVFVDVSRAYLAAAREVVHHLNLTDRAEFQQGDVTDLTVQAADLVTLDRVVCCYPDAARLLEKAAAHSRRHLALSHPLPKWWLRAGRFVLNLGMSIFGQTYRFYLHDEELLLTAAQSAGHVLQHRARYGMWQVLVLSKEEAPPTNPKAS